jgi:hypothetical protein
MGYCILLEAVLRVRNIKIPITVFSLLVEIWVTSRYSIFIFIGDVYFTVVCSPDYV